MLFLIEEVVSKKNPIIYITVDQEGIADLITQLGFLRDKKNHDIVLFTEEWGGSELSSDQANSLAPTHSHRSLVNMVQIVRSD